MIETLNFTHYLQDLSCIVLLPQIELCLMALKIILQIIRFTPQLATDYGRTLHPRPRPYIRAEPNSNLPNIHVRYKGTSTDASIPQGKDWNMAPLIPRRPRSAFAYPALPFTRRPSQHVVWKCCASPPSTAEASSERLQQVHDRMDTTRSRVRILNTRIIARTAEAGIRVGQSVLTDSSPPSQESDSISQNDAVVKKLRKELRSLKRVAEEQGIMADSSSTIEQLEGVIDQLEAALRHRDGTSTAGEFAREGIEDELEGAVAVPEDLQWSSDYSEGRPASDVLEPADLVENVKRKVVEQGNSLKRRASSVGAGIENKVSEFVKDDGSIDVDGLRMFMGKMVDNAGMTWKRLNGWVPNAGSEAEKDSAVVVASASLDVRDEEKEFKLREEIGALEKKLISSSKEREAVLRREDQLGKLIRAKEIRQMDDGVSELRRTLAVRVLQLEMEKIFVSVADEIENSDYQTMKEQRVLVVEFGDLDERLATLELFINQEEPLLVEDDTLGELAADIQDLRIRLGLDEALYSSETLSWTQVRQFWTSSAKKTRDGFEFYSRGLRLYVGDFKFALRIIRRAVTGYTPSPREIRTIRRTGRDLLTLIPFTIVLLAPLTPIGHVLVFSFLQRYWPEFFPSTFSERRQALMKRHEQYEKLVQVEAEERNQTEDEEHLNGKTDDGIPRNGGPLSGLKRLVSLGMSKSEGSEDNAKREESRDSRKGEMRDDRAETSSKNGVSIEEEKEEEEEVHPVVLSELANSVRGSAEVARRRRNTVALDDLHLAD